MRRYSESVSPSSRCFASPVIVTSAVSWLPRLAVRQRASLQLVPEVEHLAGDDLRAPFVDTLADKLPVEEARLGTGFELVEGERGADLGVEIAVAVEVDHRKGLSLQLLQERPVVGRPELLPGRPGELRVALGPFTGAPLERLPNRDRVSDHADRLRVQIAPELEGDQHAGVLHPDRPAGNRAQDL